MGGGQTARGTRRVERSYPRWWRRGRRKQNDDDETDRQGKERKGKERQKKDQALRTTTVSTRSEEVGMIRYQSNQDRHKDKDNWTRK
jgi:hypothetical protein